MQRNMATGRGFSGEDGVLDSSLVRRQSTDTGRRAREGGDQVVVRLLARGCGSQWNHGCTGCATRLAELAASSA
jgi:hypothetical protein